MHDHITEKIIQFKKQRAFEIEEQKSMRAMERKKRKTQVNPFEIEEPTVTKKDTIEFIDKTCNVKRYRKLLKNESLQLTKKELSKALNTESTKKNPIDKDAVLDSLRQQQEEEQKYLNLFGFVNKNKFTEVELPEEDNKTVEKARVKNKQHRNRADVKKIIYKQMQI